MGLSSDRKVGNFWNPAVMSAWRVAETSAAVRAEVTQRASSFLLLSSCCTTVSELEMKSLMIWFRLPRIFSVLSVSRRPGSARRSTSASASGRPARPVPSSASRRRRRSRYGRRRMLLTRSIGIVDVVCVTGTTAFFGHACGELPGWQST